MSTQTVSLPSSTEDAAATGPGSAPASSDSEELVVCSSSFFRAMGVRLANETRRAGWVAPAFTSPPSNPDVSRALMRAPDGSATVAVRLDRPAGLVAEDMIAGVKALNASAVPSRQMSVDELECELWAAALGLS